MIGIHKHPNLSASQFVFLCTFFSSHHALYYTVIQVVPTRSDQISRFRK